MARLDNPYIVGTPIPGSNHFFGREPLLKFVRDTINPPQQRVVVFYGQRRIGKTSLLLELQRRLTVSYHPVYFDLMGQANRPLALALYDIADQIAESIGLDLPREFRVPREFRTFLDSALVRLGERPLLLLLDEFDDLSDEEYIVPNAAALSLFDYLRDLLNADLPIGFIFVVGRRLTELPQNFQSILKQAPSRKVGYLNETDAHELVSTPAAGRLDFPKEAIETIYHLTSGHPYFMQLICFELFRKYGRHHPHTVTPDNVMHILDSAIETGQGGLSWFWDALPPAERFVMSALAEAGDTSGIATTDALNAVLNENRLSLLGYEITNAPDLLVKWEILQRVTPGYRFSVDLVRRWVKAEHPISKARLEVEEIVPRAKRYFENARDAQLAGQTDLAIEDYQRAVAANPNHFRAHMGLAQAYEEKGLLEEGLANYQRAYELDPENARSSLAKINDRLAMRNEQMGNLAEAIRRAKKAATISDSPTRQLKLTELQAALDLEKGRRENWFRRVRYGLGLTGSVILLALLIVYGLPLLRSGDSNGSGSTPPPDPTPTSLIDLFPESAAEEGETQIIIADFASTSDKNLSPEAVFEIRLRSEYPTVSFERITTGQALDQESAMMLAESLNSAATLYGHYSANEISARLVFRNGVKYQFDLAGEYQNLISLSAEDVDAFADSVVEEIERMNLIDLANAISQKDESTINALSGRLAPLNEE